MNEKELYIQKMQAQLDQRKAEVDKLKAQASEASADTQLKMRKQVETLERQIDDGRTKLSAVATATDDGWQIDQARDGLHLELHQGRVQGAEQLNEEPRISGAAGASRLPPKPARR